MAERIWDKFLTEQDKAHLAMSEGRKSRVGFGKKTALVIVDMYRGVFGDEPSRCSNRSRSGPVAAGWPAGMRSLTSRLSLPRREQPRFRSFTSP